MQLSLAVSSRVPVTPQDRDPPREAPRGEEESVYGGLIACLGELLLSYKAIHLSWGGL